MKLSLLFGLQGTDDDLFTLWAVFFLDNLWRCRNLLIHEHQQFKPQIFLKSITQSVYDFMEARKIPSMVIHNSSPITLSDVWNLPPPGTIKVNFDAAVSEKGFSATCIACDKHGLVQGAWVTNQVGTDLSVVEAYAARLAVTSACEKGWVLVHFEEDAQAIINAICSSFQFFSWSYEILISDIKSIVGSLISHSFRKITRASNEAAHEMAKWALRTGFSGFLNAYCLPEAVRRDCFKDS